MVGVTEDASVICPEQPSGKLKLVPQLLAALAPDALESQRKETKVATIGTAGNKHHPLARVGFEDTVQPLPGEKKLRFGIAVVDGLPSISKALEMLECVNTLNDHACVRHCMR